MASIEKSPKSPGPDYVEHLDRGARGDAMTAEDVMREFESAAKEFEAMGAELVRAVKKLEVMTAEVRDAICDTAEAYRQEGKKISGRIEECVLLTQDVRKTCEDVRGSIGGNGSVQ